MRWMARVASLLFVLGVVSGVRAAAPAVVEAPRLYAGGARTEHGEIRVELRLLDKRFFVLSLGRAPAAAGTADLTGLWRRVENGSLLQLTNRHGFALRLNVGASGNLYGDFSLVPAGPPRALTLKQAPYRVRSFDIAGRLDRDQGRPRFTDSASGRLFPLIGEALATLPGEDPLFVEATAVPAREGLRIERIRSFSARLPRMATDSPDGADFAAATRGRFWRLPSLPGLPDACCAFQETGQRRGVLEVSGRGLSFRAAYEELRGQGLNFAIRKEDARALPRAARALPEVFSGLRSWSLEGDVLVLNGEERSLALEKMNFESLHISKSAFRRTPRFSPESTPLRGGRAVSK